MMAAPAATCALHKGIRVRYLIIPALVLTDLVAAGVWLSCRAQGTPDAGMILAYVMLPLAGAQFGLCVAVYYAFHHKAARVLAITHAAATLILFMGSEFGVLV